VRMLIRKVRAPGKALKPQRVAPRLWPGVLSAAVKNT